MNELKENEETKFVDCLHVGEELYRKYAVETNEQLKETYLRESVGYLMQTFYEFKRGEGLYTLVDHFFHNKNVMLSYSLSSLLLSVPCPENGSAEFDIKLYVYDRYVLHAKITETMNLLSEAREAIKFALANIDETKVENQYFLDECAAIFDNIVKKTTK